MRIWKKLLFTGLAASTLTIGTNPALALSCVQPNLASSFDRWAASGTHYVIGRGVLTPAEKLPAKRGNSIDEQHIASLKAVSYTFKGVFIGKTKSSSVSTRVTVEPACFAVWCGGYPEGGEEAIYAFEKTAGGYRFSPTPCGGDAFWGDTRAMEKQVRKCMKKGTCNP